MLLIQHRKYPKAVSDRAKGMLDNMGAAYGELPDEATLRRMEALVDGLPSA